MVDIPEGAKRIGPDEVRSMAMGALAGVAAIAKYLERNSDNAHLADDVRDVIRRHMLAAEDGGFEDLLLEGLFGPKRPPA